MLSSVLSFALAAAASDAGNVIWIVLDDVSIEYLEVYGEGPAATQPPTPNIDRLADRGLRFENFYVDPVCSPTRAALLTGEYAWRSGIGDVDADNELPWRTITLPEAIAPSPSVLIGVWKLGLNEFGPLAPIAHGYDLYAGRMKGRRGYYDWTQTASWRWSSRELDVAQYRPSRDVDDLLRVVKQLPEPWFVTFNTNSAHTPLHLPPAALHSQGVPQDDQGLYMAMVEAADTEVGRLLAHLDLERTTVFLLSDNGTIGSLSHPPNTGKNSTHEGGVNCPLIIAGRGAPKGRLTSSLAGAVDLYETTLELMGHAGRHDPRDGVSLAPVLADPKAEVRPRIYGEQFGDDPSTASRYARDSRYKLRSRLVAGTVVNEFFHDLATAPPGEDGPALDLDGLDDAARASLARLRELITHPER